jgi:hypothetical protein
MKKYLYIIFVILLYSNIYKTIYYSNNIINDLELWLKEFEMKIMDENNFLIKYDEERNKKIKEIEVYFDDDDIILKSEDELTNEDAQNIFNYLLENEYIELIK